MEDRRMTGALWRASAVAARRLAALGTLLMVALLAGCAAAGGVAATDAGPSAALVAAPAFALPRLDGQGALDLADLRGRVVVLNVWASWCPPCRAEAPTFSAVARAFADRGVTVLGVNVQDTPEAAERFVRDYALTYPNVRDEEGGVARAYGALGLPTTVLIDRQGRIARRWIGALTERQLVAFIEEVV